MTTFDGWEAQLYGPDTLAHFRTKGSKNGVRRYQNEDGTWTPLGLKERKAREGWGEQRRAARAERKAARQEKRAANAAAQKERMAAFKEKQRANNVKTMTDEELRKRIDRLKLEQEYKEMAKSPLLKTGERLISGYLDYRAKKEQARQAREKNAMDMARIRADITKTKELTKQKVFDAKKAKSDAGNAAAQAKKAQITRKRDILNSKIAYKSTTIRGGFSKMINKTLTGIGEARAATLKDNAEAKKGVRFVNELFRTRKRVDKYNEKLKPWQTSMEQDPDEWNRKKNK